MINRVWLHPQSDEEPDFKDLQTCCAESLTLDRGIEVL